jgi:sec-independent protein translocase protein TatA
MLTPETNCRLADGTAGIVQTSSTKAKVIDLISLRDSKGAAMGLGIPELIVIILLIILMFGASRLPEIGRGLGKGIRNFKAATREGSEDR